MASLQLGKSIVYLGDKWGLYRGRKEGGDYLFEILDGSDSVGYYKKHGDTWERSTSKKLEAAELYKKGLLFIESYVYFMDNHNLVRGKIFNTSPLVLIVRGMKIEKRLDEVFTFEETTGTVEELKALSRALPSRCALQPAMQDETHTDKATMEERATNFL